MALHSALAGQRALTGFFITFEGGEGSGKTTQIARLAEALSAQGQAVTTTREPGGSPGADALRHIILSGAAEVFGAEMETMLFAAARMDHVEEVIRPAIEAGRIVLCDRFHDSTRVYQGLAGVDPALLETLERATLAGLYPDLTIILDVPAKDGLARARLRRGAAAADRFERESVVVHEERRAAFLAIADAEPQRCAVIDAGRPADVVAKEIGFLVTERLACRALETGRRGRGLQPGRRSAMPGRTASS